MIRRTASGYSFDQIMTMQADSPAPEKPAPEVKRITAFDLRPALRFAFSADAVQNIQNEVAQFYGLDPDLMRRADSMGMREQRISHPRQTAMFLAREITGRSYPFLGRRFGGRDHTTIMHAVRAVEKRIKTDPYLEIEVEVLRERIAA